jgi:hypothetical protein
VASVWPRWTSRGRTGGTTAEAERDQLAQVEVDLAKGAEANGYPNDLCTLKGLAEVIERVTGVS